MWLYSFPSPFILVILVKGYCLCSYGGPAHKFLVCLCCVDKLQTREQTMHVNVCVPVELYHWTSSEERTTDLKIHISSTTSNSVTGWRPCLVPLCLGLCQIKGIAYQYVNIFHNTHGKLTASTLKVDALHILSFSSYMIITAEADFCPNPKLRMMFCH